MPSGTAASITKLVSLWILLLLPVRPSACAQTKAAVELESAISKEHVDGDLKAAIAEYRKISADDSAPRNIRAKALLHLAACYEDLGQQAQTIYRQLVRDFSDQPEASQARAKLASLTQTRHPVEPLTMTQRKIDQLDWMGPGDTDGYRAVYYRDNGELISGDLAGTSKRVIFTVKPARTPGASRLGWFPSRDFSIVGLEILKPDGEIFSTVKTDGTGYREIAKLPGYHYCWNWSWDNRYMLTCGRDENLNYLIQISIADGQIRTLVALKPETSSTISAAAFSPDGHFVAYQVHSRVTDSHSQIFIVPTEGGDRQMVYEERSVAGRPDFEQSLKLLDWTADGRYLAIASERTGKPALNLLPIRGAKVIGSPLFVKYGNYENGRITNSGRLIYSSIRTGGAWDVNIARLDATGRAGAWRHLDLRLGNEFNPMPHWSYDNSAVIYTSRNDDIGEPGTAIHRYELSTGEDREIDHAQGYAYCAPSAKEPTIFCSERAGNMAEVFSLSDNSGERKHLGAFSNVIFVYPSRQGQSLYMYRTTSQDSIGDLVKWDRTTGMRTLLDRGRADIALPIVSPDENWLIRSNNALEIRPLPIGDWKQLAALSQPSGQTAVTPDGKWIFYHDLDTSGKHSLFRVPLAGGAAQRLGDFPSVSFSGTMEISPDGSQVMVSAECQSCKHELWSLENFVPVR